MQYCFSTLFSVCSAPDFDTIINIYNFLKGNNVTTVVCGSCYGAETPERKCCNNCNDVREAYRLKTWKFDPRGIEQCRDGLGSEVEERALKEGCQIYGYLDVNRVGG